MNYLQFAILTFILCWCNASTMAQTNIKSYSFKKGEILDMLLLSAKPNTDALFKDYVKVAFPVAIEMSYKNLPGFKIEDHTQGNLHPKSLIFGKWDNVEKREQFLTEVESFVPDFHKRRRDIWSVFNLTYYEMPETTFEINKGKYNVVTAYWQKDEVSFQKFKTTWLEKSRVKGGKTILALSNGKSPFGYYYRPDYLVITQWESKEVFDTFFAENLKMDHTGVLHVNQFAIN